MPQRLTVGHLTVLQQMHFNKLWHMPPNPSVKRDWRKGASMHQLYGTNRGMQLVRHRTLELISYEQELEN